MDELKNKIRKILRNYAILEWSEGENLLTETQAVDQIISLFYDYEK